MKKVLLATLFFTLIITGVRAQYHNTKVIITGYMPNPSGTDDNYEYVQLMATEHIDFSETPYAVIIAHGSNSGANNPTGTPTNGWATGKLTNGTSQTTQFSLTSGEFNAGDYFYIGGAGKKINGSTSTDISETAVEPQDKANWVRTIDIKADGWSGDNGIGGGSFSSGAMFGNVAVPQGIAVFATNSVNEQTVPVDVVFFGSALSGSTAIGRYYKLESGTELGYRICNTDRYDTANGAFFYKGTNTFVFPPSNSSNKENVFFKLGGIYNTATKTWTEKRDGVTEITLPSNAAGTLALIETGGTLPVDLAFIKAEVSGKVIRLNWSTVSESKNAYFEILRSVDGVTFNQIGKIEGNGTTQVSQQYSFTDNAPFTGTNYYRLKQIDTDGKSSLSKIVSANTDFVTDVFKAWYSNGNIEASFNHSEAATVADIVLSDITGGKLASYKTEVVPGINNLSFKALLIPGVYVVTLSSGKSLHTVKILAGN